MHRKISHVMSLVSLISLAPAAVHAANYVQHNLVSDVAGLADRTDANLVNAWGIVHSATSPWWVNDNETGVSEVFDGAGQPFPSASPIVVTVPPAGSATPTGIVFNGTTDFEVVTGKPAVFIFASEDGSISGWNRDVDPANAVTKVPSSADAVYKGVAMGQQGSANFLFAANFRSRAVDVFDKTFTKVTLAAGAFTDGTIPTGYAPFNVQNINGDLYVAFAKQDDTKHDEVDGRGLGYVDVFDTAGNLKMRLEHGHWMNAPWGIAFAPAGFGKFSNHILVGNFGSGRIVAFDASSGKFRGRLRGSHGTLKIDGLWGIGFGNDANAGPSTTLYFAAGIQDEGHGLFGTITPKAGKEDGSDDGDDDQDDN